MRVEDEKFLAALVLALGVVVAFYFESVTKYFVPYLLPSLFFVMVFSLLPYVSYGRQTFTKLHPAVLPLVFIQQLVLPSLTAVGGTLLNVDPQILFFVMVTVTSGSLFASPTLVHLMGLDQRLAVQTVVISTLAAPLSIFIGFKLLGNGNLTFDFMNFTLRLIVFLIVPIAIFFAIRIFAKNWSRETKELSTRIGRWGSVLSLVVFCFALDAPVAAALKTSSNTVIYYLFVSLTATFFVAFGVKLVMNRFGYTVAMTASILASFRNIGLTFGLVGHLGGSELAIYVGVSQIPMFFAPLLFEFFFGRQNRAEKELTVAGAKEDVMVEAGYPDPNMPIEPVVAVKPTGTFAKVIGAIKAPMARRSPAIKSSTAVAMSQGAVVGAEANELTQTEFEPSPHEEPQIATAPEGEGARDLIGRLEDHYQGKDKSKANLLSAFRGSGLGFASVALGLFLVGVAGVWHANKYFAPMLFDQALIAEVAQTHTEGRNFGVFDLNINIRDLRNETIKRMTKTPEVGILGASHWQEAHVSLLSGVDLYNSHIHRDYYEDMMAMVEIYERHGRLPKELIITIRDKLLTPVKDRTDFLWLPGIKYYRDFAERVGYPAHSMIETLPVATWRELVNVPLLKAHGSRHLAAPVMPHATDKRQFETLDVLLPGGSIIWSDEHMELFSKERARNEALAFAEASKNSPPKIDPKGIEHMEFLFQYLKDKGINVTLAHPQFNPIFWNEVQGTEYMVGLKKIEDLTKSWAEKYDFGLVGGFAPEQVGCKAEQYIDAEHGNPACLGMLLMQYRFQSDEFKLRGAI